jgi:hypothetical protein
MEQLVGCLCVRCQKTIPSVLEGEFCKSCCSPVHTRCKSSPEDPLHCAECGLVIANTVADGLRREREQEQDRDRKQLHRPVCRVCPACGSTEYTKTRPLRLITFTSDRVCAKCGTYYSVPDPKWLTITYIVGSFIVMGLGFAAAIRHSNFQVLLYYAIPATFVISRGFWKLSKKDEKIGDHS